MLNSSSRSREAALSIMLVKSLALLSLIVPLLAAPANENENLQDQGPPKEFKKPFGEGKQTTSTNPHKFTVVAKQRSDGSDYKKSFNGAPTDNEPERSLASPSDWKDNWAFACDFPGNDLENAQIPGEECGGRCETTNECTHFTWTPFEGGTCWLKKGPVSKSQAVAFKNADAGMVCGIRSSIFSADDTATETPAATSSEVHGIVWTGNWAFGCDFPGFDLANARTTGKDCSGRCSVTPQCTHFTWSTFEGGTCWMKEGPISKEDASSKNGDQSFVCGVIEGTGQLPSAEGQNAETTETTAVKRETGTSTEYPDSRVQIDVPVAPTYTVPVAPPEKQDTSVPVVPSCPACVCQCPLPVFPVADPGLSSASSPLPLQLETTSSLPNVAPAANPLPPVAANPWVQPVDGTSSRPTYNGNPWQKVNGRNPMDSVVQQMMRGALQNSGLGYLFNNGGSTNSIPRQADARTGYGDESSDPFARSGPFGGNPFGFNG